LKHNKWYKQIVLNNELNCVRDGQRRPAKAALERHKTAIVHAEEKSKMIMDTAVQKKGVHILWL
jgi:hypothetical protein